MSLGGTESRQGKNGGVDSTKVVGLHDLEVVRPKKEKYLLDPKLQG